MGKNLLFISTNIQWGGSEVLWTNVCEKILDGGNNNISCVIEDWDYEPEVLKKIKQKGGSIYKNKTIVKKGIKAIIAILKRKPRTITSVNLEKVIQSFKPNLAIISIGDDVSSKLVSITDKLKAYDIPYFILIQLATEYRNIDDNLSEMLLRSYISANKCYFLCEENKKSVENHIGSKLINASYFNSPFNFNNLSKDSLAYEGDDVFFNLGMVTNLNVFHKGHDLLIQVLSKDKWKERNININIYGNGENKKLIERLIKMYDIKDKIKLMGYVKSPEEIWKYNQACIFTSRMEGQSLAMLDALSLGRMVISTAVGDAANLIDDEESGFIIPNQTVESIDMVLEKAWGKRNDWIEIGKKAKQKLKERITKDPIQCFVEEITPHIV